MNGNTYSATVTFVSGANYTWTANVTATVPVSATDPDLPTNTLIYALSVTVDTNATIANGWSNSLAYATTNPPPVINPTNGVITWTPSETQGPAVYDVTVFVTDTNQYALTNQSYTVSTNFTITVLETNSAPFWTNGYPNVVMNVLQVTNVFGSATDTDLPPNILTWMLPGASPWSANRAAMMGRTSSAYLPPGGSAWAAARAGSR